MSTNLHHGVEVVENGMKLTDDAIIPVLELIATKNIDYILPAVLACAELPEVTIPNLSQCERAVLIVHLGHGESDGHWVLVTYDEGRVCVYDSMNASRPCPQLRHVICRVFSPSTPIHMVPVATTQRNSQDCGVLASAFAVEWSFGGDPATVLFDYEALRPHLSYLLRYKNLVSFPKTVSVKLTHKDKAKRVEDIIVPVKKPRMETYVISELNEPIIVKEIISVEEAAAGSVTTDEVSESNEMDPKSQENVIISAPCDMNEIQTKVLKLLKEKYNISVLLSRKGETITKRSQKILILCHVNNQKANYYSVMSCLPSNYPSVNLYDFCGRKYSRFITKKEKDLASHYVNRYKLKIMSAPCAASRRNNLQSHLLSLLTLLMLARDSDPLRHLDFGSDCKSLYEKLCQYIDQGESEGQGGEGIEEEDSIEENLKNQVIDKIAATTHIKVHEAPHLRERKQDAEFMAIIEVVNKQRGNNYFSAMHWVSGPLVTIFDFCGRTYDRDILDLEKQYAKRACGPHATCILARNPTVASKKDREKTLIYSLMTLLSIAEGREIWSRVSARQDVTQLRRTLKEMLEGVYGAEEEEEQHPDVIRPLFQRRRSRFGDAAINLGGMDVVCVSCRAKYFRCEVENDGGPQPYCCKGGLIGLPHSKSAPQLLVRLMTENSEEGKHFRSSIYRYNSAVAFASLHVNHPQPEGAGSPVYIVQGQIYTTMYRGRPDNNRVARGNQIYFLGIDDCVSNTVTNRFGLRAPIVRDLQDMLRENNPYAKAYSSMCEFLTRQENIGQINLGMRADLNAIHRGTGSLPSAEEVAVVYTVSENGAVGGGTLGSMVVYTQPEDIPQLIHLNTASAEPMLFPLLNPYGQSGYVRVESDYTFRDYCMYLLSRRDEFSTLKHGRRLKQAWICFQFLKMEDDRLSYVAQNQRKLRAESYKGLQDFVRRRAQEENAAVGRVVVLPATFTGSPRYMHQKYLDALAAVCHFGRYDIVVTITTNPRWPEITDNIPEGQTLADNCDLVNRVFQAKLMRFMEMIEKEQVLGHVAAWLYVIEFQKRGLPHAHCFIIFTPQDCG